MKICIKLAGISSKEGEVPVGSVVVKNNQIIGFGRNLVNSTKIISDHAEIIAINNATRFLHEWRLVDCDIYVTLEPCMMCVGAINNARIKRVIYGTKNYKFGAIKYINSKIEIVSGILESECSYILSNFFRKMRKN